MARRRLTWATLGLVLLAVVTAVVAVMALADTAGAPAPRPTQSALTNPPTESALP